MAKKKTVRRKTVKRAKKRPAKKRAEAAEPEPESGKRLRPMRDGPDGWTEPRVP